MLLQNAMQTHGGHNSVRFSLSVAGHVSYHLSSDSHVLQLLVAISNLSSHIISILLGRAVVSGNANVQSWIPPQITPFQAQKRKPIIWYPGTLQGFFLGNHHCTGLIIECCHCIQHCLHMYNTTGNDTNTQCTHTHVLVHTNTHTNIGDSTHTHKHARNVARMVS